jgi:hypothetical protein
MIRSIYFFGILSVAGAIIFSCTKKQGTNPDLAFSDSALLDSCKNSSAFTYYQNKDSVYTGAHGPHGAFKLKFNKIGYTALTSSGKLPVNGKFPDNSLIVKEVFSAGKVDLYALMYKRNGSWLWAEIYPDGKVNYSVYKESSVCTDCHKQSGNRDLVNSFNYY